MAAPPDGKAHSAVLGSAVYNEAEAIFRLLEHKDRKCVSHLDTVTLMRGMGMNPTQKDIEALAASMAPLVAELDDLRMEEERKKDLLRKKEEAKSGKDAKDAKKPDPKKPGGKDAKGKEGEAVKEDGAAKEGEEGAPKKKVLTEPAEEVKNIDWHIFITNVEPVYKDNKDERAEIVAALKWFDDGSGKMTIEKLLEIVCTNGESVLSPAERKQFLEAFPMQTIEFEEFANRIQGTYQPPPPPSAEELARIAEEERQRLEAAKKAAQANDFDALLGGDPTLAAPES